MPKKVVLIGAATAGIHFREQLLKLFKASPSDIEIIIIEKQQSYAFNVAVPRALVDQTFATKIHFNLQSLLSETQGRVVHGTVESFTDKAVRLENGDLIEYDYLVIASGSSYPIFKPQELTLDDSLKLLDSVRKDIEAATNIYFVGGGATAVETAAEVKSYHPEKNVTIIHSSAGLLGPSLGSRDQAALLKKVQELGINVVLNQKVQLASIKKGRHKLNTEDGSSFDSDLTLTAIGGQKPNSEFCPSRILDQKKRVKVQSTLQVDDSSLPTVFAIGDVAATDAPQSYMTARAHASVAAENIASLIKTGKTRAVFEPPKKVDIFMLALGKKSAFGILPFMPSVLSHFMARSFKSPNLFADKNAPSYNLKFEKE